MLKPLFVFLAIFACLSVARAQEQTLRLADIKKREDFPKQFFTLQFTNNRTLTMRFIQVGYQEMPKYYFGLHLIAISTTAAKGSFGANVDFSLRPVKYIDLQGYVHIPYAIFGENKRPDGAKYKHAYRYFLSSFSPTFFLHLKSRVKLRKSGMAGNRISSGGGIDVIEGFVFKLPTYISHFLGLAPVYMYSQGFLTNKDNDIFGVRYQTLGITLNYRRIGHTVLEVQGYGKRRYSSILDVYGGFLVNAANTVYYNFIDSTSTERATRVHLTTAEKFGYIGGIKYMFTFNTALPVYVQTRLEFARLPSYYNHMHINLAFGFVFYVPNKNLKTPEKRAAG